MIYRSKSFKLETLISHEKSKCHIYAKEIDKNINKKETPAVVASRLLTIQATQMMQNKFRNAHWVLKYLKPYRDYERLNLLDEAKNLDVGMTYRNKKSCRKFGMYISQVEEEKYHT